MSSTAHESSAQVPTPSSAPAAAPSAKLKVVNLFGAPGTGKSSVRSGLFWLMKSLQMSVEEVSEYAKYLVLAGRQWQLTHDQNYLFAKQHHKQLIIERAGYEYAVTDSPMLLCSFYCLPEHCYDGFLSMVDDAMERFENINFYLSREQTETEFETRGRRHDLQASREVDARMREFLDRKGIRCVDMPVDFLTPWRILHHLAPERVPGTAQLALLGLQPTSVVIGWDGHAQTDVLLSHDFNWQDGTRYWRLRVGLDAFDSEGVMQPLTRWTGETRPAAFASAQDALALFSRLCAAAPLRFSSAL